MKSLHVLLALLLGANLWAQDVSNGSIHGQIQANNQPVEVFITLLNATNQQLVKTEISDNQGNFEFVGIPIGTYIIAVDEPSYQIYQSAPIELSENSLRKNVGQLHLQTLTTEALKEVVVQRKVPVVEQKLDRTVVNVDALLSAKGGDAVDVLEKSPGIQINEDGVITYKGRRGVSVFIDGKPTYLTGTELQSYLKSLSADVLNQIEFMTNPPAQYDAAGSAGVINIITKKSKNKGIQGSFSARVGMAKRIRNRQTLQMSYVNENFKVFGNLGYDYVEAYNDLSIKRKFLNSDGTVRGHFDQSSILENNVRNINLGLGSEYYLSEKTLIGARISGILNNHHSLTRVNSWIMDSNFALDSSVVAKNFTKNLFKNLSVGLNLRHQFSETTTWSADADYLIYDTQSDQRFNNRMFAADGSQTGMDGLWGEIPSEIRIATFKTDFTKSLGSGWNSAIGYKISTSKTDNTADYRDDVNGVLIPNYDRTNHFKYDETIQAAYVNTSKEWNRFSAQLGLRVENTVTKGHQLGNVEKPETVFNRNYFHVFPTAFLQYKLDSIGGKTLSASYGKRITRPVFQDLNPFVSPLDKFTYYSGNPYLKPSLSHNLEATYNHHNWFSSTLGYGFAKDDMNETIQIVDGIYYSTSGNIGKNQYYTWNTNWQFSVTDFWSSQFYTELTHVRFESPLFDTQFKSEGTYVGFSTQQRFKLGNDWAAEVSGNYYSDRVSAQFIVKSKGVMNLAVSKKILKQKGNLRFVLDDVFLTGIHRGVINNLENTEASWSNRTYSRRWAISFSYSFGKLKSVKETFDNSGSEEERNRVRS